MLCLVKSVIKLLKKLFNDNEWIRIYYCSIILHNDFVRLIRGVYFKNYMWQDEDKNQTSNQVLLLLKQNQGK